MKLPEMHTFDLEDSSNVEAAGYEAASSTLFVRFRRKGQPGRGEVYLYRGVPHHVYQELLESARPGQYFTDNIRSAGFNYEKITDKIKVEETEPPTA